MKRLEPKAYRRAMFPGGFILVLCGLQWLPYPMGVGIRSAVVGFGVIMIAAAFWEPKKAYRLRTMMAAVAAFGLLLGFFLMALRRDRYLDRARFHANRAQFVNSLRTVFKSMPDGFPETTAGISVPFKADLGGPIHLYKDAEAIELARWHEALAAKYTLAASRPWAAIEPDSAPPFDEASDRSLAAKAAMKKGER